MKNNIAGFPKFIAYCTLAIGLLCVAAATFGIVYLARHGAIAKASAYILGMTFGVSLAVSGIALLKGKRWSRYIYLLISAVALVPMRGAAPMIIWFLASTPDHSIMSSVVGVLEILFTYGAVFLLSLIPTIVVLRHFRKQSLFQEPTLAELTQHDVRDYGA